MTVEENKAVIRRLRRIINSGAFEELEDVFTPDYVRHDPNPLLKDAGVNEYRKALQHIRTAFPDADWTIEELLVDGDRVVGRWSFKGTHTGPFFNIPPTGKVIRYPILAIYRIADGKIAEDWHIFHAIGLWEQLIPEIGVLLRQATV